MASSPMESGELVLLQDLHPCSPHFKQGASLRVTGKLQEYSVETAIATVVDGNDRLKIDTKLSLTFGLDPCTSSSANCIFNPIMKQSCRHMWVGMLMASTSSSIISHCNC